MNHHLTLPDPYNLIITGVGGQGNVMISKVIGQMLSKQGFYVTIGETFGASQRGGSVMSHLRISKDAVFSPQIARGGAHMVVALELTEALRVLNTYGSKTSRVLSNTCPVHSVGVISGEQTYPERAQLTAWINELTEKAWFVDATQVAMETMKHSIFGNIILLGALARVSSLPLPKDVFQKVITRFLPPKKVGDNLQAFDLGMGLIKV